jgi:hypothetical protein
VSGPVDGGGYTLGKQALTQIGEVVRQFNGGGGASANRGFIPKQSWNHGTMDAVVATAIGPATGNTYGTGQVTVMISSSNNGTFQAIPNPSYNGPQTCLNWSQNSGTINANTHVSVYYNNGNLELNWADCSS